jgi:hypothetical protein
MTGFHSYNRWNFKPESDGVYVCYGDHHRSGDCEWVKLSPEQIIETLDFLIKETVRGDHGKA